MKIRRAVTGDIGRISELLSQVLEIHAKLRPDIFIPGRVKYTPDELETILCDDSRPVYVAEDGKGSVAGYAFCQLRERPFSNTMIPGVSMFIDDLCVDSSFRGKHVGSLLFEFVCSEAKRLGCADVTLDVWEGNDAAFGFYGKMGMRTRERRMELFLDLPGKASEATQDETPCGDAPRTCDGTGDDREDSRIDRISRYEAILDRLRSLADRCSAAQKELDDAGSEIDALAAYYGSDDWRSDFEADEAGLLPQDLKRGVLSEDAVYDLLEEIDGLKGRK